MLSLCYYQYQYDEHLPGELAQVLLPNCEVLQVGEGQQLVKIFFMLVEVMMMVIMVMIMVIKTWGRGSCRELSDKSTRLTDLSI